MAAAGIRFLFAPHTVHEIWPDYGYRLDRLRDARVCTDDAFIAQAPDFTLDYAALVHPDPEHTYAGVTLHPIEFQEGTPPSDNYWNDLWSFNPATNRLTLEDLCQLIQPDTIVSTYATTTCPDVTSWSPPTHIITNKVLPDTQLTFDIRFNLEPAPEHSITQATLLDCYANLHEVEVHLDAPVVQEHQ